MRGKLIVLPSTLRQRAIDLAHNDAHQGMVRTKQRLKAVYWWPAMDRMIEEAISGCHVCANSDRTTKRRAAPMEPTALPSEPWERLAVDIIGPDGSLGVQNRFAVVIIDYYSKWAEVELMSEVSAAHVVEMFRRLFYREGIPRYIVSDNGVQFISREFQNMLTEFRIQHVKTPLYHPMANGLCERFNRTLGGFFETAKATNKNIRLGLREMIGAYNATPQATTGKSPAELLHGRRMRTRVDVIGRHMEREKSDQTLRKQVLEKQNNQKTYADNRRAAKEVSFGSGDWVRIRKATAAKGESKYTTPVQ
ncbi:uncharacterized protein K02A2.6-like, partial [Galendromus occidentalis]|uniref:RNA-directed DNA polymerase n=1 Tax=Galendromus occidentalis TaxID=34638 RepID=A0AAJ6QZ04_9ACAR